MHEARILAWWLDQEKWRQLGHWSPGPGEGVAGWGGSHTRESLFLSSLPLPRTPGVQRPHNYLHCRVGKAGYWATLEDWEGLGKDSSSVQRCPRHWGGALAPCPSPSKLAHAFPIPHVTLPPPPNLTTPSTRTSWGPRRGRETASHEGGRRQGESAASRCCGG